MAKNRATVQINTDRCKECGLCISFCPQEALSLDEQINQRGFHPVRFSDQAGCTGCLRCQLMCPDLAIFVGRGKRTSEFQYKRLFTNPSSRLPKPRAACLR